MIYNLVASLYDSQEQDYTLEILMEMNTNIVDQDSEKQSIEYLDIDDSDLVYIQDDNSDDSRVDYLVELPFNTPNNLLLDSCTKSTTIDDYEQLVAINSNGSCYLREQVGKNQDATTILCECMEARLYEIESDSKVDYLIDSNDHYSDNRPVENYKFADSKVSLYELGNCQSDDLVAIKTRYNSDSQAEKSQTLLLSECLESISYEDEKETDIGYLLENTLDEEPVEMQDSKPLVAFEANDSCQYYKDSIPKGVGKVLLSECMEAISFEHEDDSALDYLLADDSFFEHEQPRQVENKIKKEECEDLVIQCHEEINSLDAQVIEEIKPTSAEKRIINLYEHVHPSGSISGQDLLNSVLKSFNTLGKYSTILSEEERTMLRQFYQSMSGNGSKPLDSLLSQQLKKFRSKRFTSKL